MSKITFRADDDLVSRLEEFDASKSEVMREALREYLDRDRRTGSTEGQDASATTASSTSTGTAAVREATTLDDALATRIDELFEERVGRMLDERLDRRIDRRLATVQPPTTRPQDIDLSISLDGARVADAPSNVGQERTGGTDDAYQAGDAPADASADAQSDATPAEADDGETNCCKQCGESLSDDHVYCPNCGEKRSHRVFCDCGDEVRTDWAFCPSCGRRTPAADVLDRP